MMTDPLKASTEGARNLAEKEAITNMAGLVLRFLELNKLPNLGYRQVKALTKRLYQMGVKGRKLP